MIRRIGIALLLSCACLMAGAADLKPGQDYRDIDPPLAPDRNKVEVTEFFWYGCPHCFNLESVIPRWAGKLPPSVNFRRVPVVFPDGKWTPGARLYYTLEAMNLLERLHADVFFAIHVERKRLHDQKTLFEWVAGKGVDAKAFAEAWGSFGVHSRVQQARELTTRAGLNGVPAMVVDGRYQAITPEKYEDLLTLVDRLIDRARAERGGK